MSTSYLPHRDAELLTWARNYAALVTADPAAYGLDEGAGDAVQDAANDYAAAYQTANDPVTRSPANVEIKNTKRDFLIDLVRQQVRRIQGWKDITDDKRAALGITVPKTTRTPVPAPAVAPQLDVVKVEGRLVSLRLREAATGKRRKPDGVYSATIMKHVGASIPDDLDQWVLVGSDTRLDTKVDFPDTLAPGTKVWFTAFWLNRRAESGPMCVPVSTHLGYDVAVSGQQANDPEDTSGDDLRIAA